jgi:hypothetical protein
VVNRRGSLHARPVIGDDVTALAEPCQRARPEWSGFDAEVHNEARDQFEMFDTLMQWPQQRRMVLLREISLRREFAKREENKCVRKGDRTRIPLFGKAQSLGS